ncbi:MAG: TIR domain-containing protein [Methanobacteriaceae archaeon]
MEELHIHKLFISHNGKGNEEYLNFFQRLMEAPDFEWKDYGVPGENESEQLEEQIKPVQLVIILSGLYKRHQKLIKKQVEITRKMNKPLLLIRPYGMEEVPTQLEPLANDIIGWNRVCIVETILENI